MWIVLKSSPQNLSEYIKALLEAETHVSIGKAWCSMFMFFMSSPAPVSSPILETPSPSPSPFILIDDWLHNRIGNSHPSFRSSVAFDPPERWDFLDSEPSMPAGCFLCLHPVHIRALLKLIWPTVSWSLQMDEWTNNQGPWLHAWQQPAAWHQQALISRHLILRYLRTKPSPNYKDSTYKTLPKKLSQNAMESLLQGINLKSTENLAVLVPFASWIQEASQGSLPTER